VAGSFLRTCVYAARVRIPTDFLLEVTKFDFGFPTVFSAQFLPFGAATLPMSL
jgi:hypothetical protein